jgi:hypothetical protein
MALKLLQSGIQPLGQFDGLDAEYTTLLGGEVVTFTYLSITSWNPDQAASDIDDGYVGTTTKRRPAVTKTLVSGNRPLFLCDEGTTDYGTLFGEVVGAIAGKGVTGGTVLGPHTATGSGKVTLWDKPGLYAVTLDAVDTTASTGLVPTNTTLAGMAAVYATTAGLLTPNAGAAFESVVVARFVEFTTDGSLVTTPANLVSARNSPSGSGVAALVPFTQAVVHFNPETS